MDINSLEKLNDLLDRELEIREVRSLLFLSAGH